MINNTTEEDEQTSSLTRVQKLLEHVPLSFPVKLIFSAITYIYIYIYIYI